MSEHTKEPWKLVGYSIYNADTYIAFLEDIDAEDARRIVACVNACEGISTSLLERATPFDTALFFKAQRDELLEVVKYTRQVLPQDIWANDLRIMLDIAIANAEDRG